jgi:hypothetical protein
MKALPAQLRKSVLFWVLAALVVSVGPEAALGERVQRGDLIVSLDGRLSPLRLPRERPAAVTLRLSGGLHGTGGSQIPRVTRIELALPAQGVLNTRGLPLCRPAQLRYARPREALAACRGALVGRGLLAARAVIPDQAPFEVRARLLAFNAKVGHRRAVVLHSYSSNPPTVAVLPLVLHRRDGRFGMALVGNVSGALGPWPRLAHFQVSLSRRFRYRGASRSYLTASCPIPERITAGFFSFARATYTLGDGRNVSVGITRGCRAG